MKIGEKIKARRLELGMTVDELAEKIGKNRATVYRYEKSEIENLPTTVLDPLVKALDVTPDFLMGWEDLPDLSTQEQAVIDFMKENPDMKTAFITASEADLTPEQKASVAASMIAHVKALKNLDK